MICWRLAKNSDWWLWKVNLMRDTASTFCLIGNILVYWLSCFLCMIGQAEVGMIALDFVMSGFITKCTKHMQRPVELYNVML